MPQRSPIVTCVLTLCIAAAFSPAEASTHRDCHHRKGTTSRVRQGGPVQIATLSITKTNGQVHFAFTVANQSDKPFDLHFANSSRLQVTVADGAGAIVWDSTAGQMFAAVLGTESITAHAQKTFTADWDPADLHGAFVAKSKLRSIPAIDAKEHPLSLP